MLKSFRDKNIVFLSKQPDRPGEPWVRSWMEIQRNFGIISEFSSKTITENYGRTK